MRTNLDPFNYHDDATLNEALRQSYLIGTHTAVGSAAQSVHSQTAGTSTPVDRFSLDTVIETEGANLSVGQKSLVSLARALVVNANILVLDEATASVDYLTGVLFLHTTVENSDDACDRLSDREYDRESVQA